MTKRSLALIPLVILIGAAPAQAKRPVFSLSVPVRESGLVNKKRRVISLHAGRVEDFTFGPATGRTAIAYNVTLRRVR
jgi:hypothetical protein